MLITLLFGYMYSETFKMYYMLVGYPCYIFRDSEMIVLQSRAQKRVATMSANSALHLRFRGNNKMLFHKCNERNNFATNIVLGTIKMI